MDADNLAIENKIMKKVAEEKEKMLAGRRKIAAELKVKRDAERDRRAKERNDEFNDTYKDILKKEKEDELAEKQRLADEERKKQGSAGKVFGSLGGAFKKLPGMGLGRRSSFSPFGGSGGSSSGGEGGGGGKEKGVSPTGSGSILGRVSPTGTKILERVSPTSFLKKKTPGRKKSSVKIPPIALAGSNADKEREDDEKKDI